PQLPRLRLRRGTRGGPGARRAAQQAGPPVRGAARFGKGADPADAAVRMHPHPGRAHQPLGVGTGGAIAAASAHAARAGRRPRLGAPAVRIARGPLPALPGTLRPAAAPAAAGLLRFLPADTVCTEVLPGGQRVALTTLVSRLP